MMVEESKQSRGEAGNRPRIFLSYARGDDEPFVRRLYEDLRARGFEVWFDRMDLPSLQLTFHQEIKDAIRTRAVRLIYVAGPKAAISDYVREEWQFALELDLPVIPILRLGDYDLVPGGLRLLHCEDFRDDRRYGEALDKLCANIERPEPSLGAMYAVPSLPPHFLGRKELLERVRNALLVDLQKPVVITGAAARVGVQGMGGIGKSVLAAALARDRGVRRAFPDGVVWVAVGQAPGLPGLMRDVAVHLGCRDLIESVAQGQGVLKKLLGDKAVLLVLDDVWEAAHAAAFDVLGPRCRALVTTRDAGVLHTLGGQVHPVALFTEPEALQLAADIAGVPAAALPPEAREVVRECGLLAMASDGRTAVSGSGDWTVKVWDLGSGALLHTLEGHRADVMSVAIASNGRIAVSGSFDNTLKVWDLRSGRLVRTLEGHQSVVGSVAIAPDGRTAVSGSGDGTVKVWNLESRRLLRTLESHQSVIGSVAIAPDGRTAVSGSGDGTVKVWNLESGRLLRTLEAHENGDSFFAREFGMGRAGTAADIGGWGMILLLTGRLELGVRTVAMAPGGRTAVSGSADKTLRVWDLASGRLLHTLEGHEDTVNSVAIALDGRIAVSASSDRTLKVWDLSSGALLRTLEGHQGSVVTVAITADGRTAVSASSDRTLKVWDLSSGALLRTLEGHQGSVTVAITPDGRTAVSASSDQTLKVWDLSSGTLLRTLEGQQNSAMVVAITSDGRTAVSASLDKTLLDKTLKVWDLSSGRLLGNFSGDAGFFAVAVTPSVPRVVAGDALGRVHFLDLLLPDVVPPTPA